MHQDQRGLVLPSHLLHPWPPDLLQRLDIFHHYYHQYLDGGIHDVNRSVMWYSLLGTLDQPQGFYEVLSDGAQVLAQSFHFGFPP